MYIINSQGILTVWHVSVIAVVISIKSNTDEKNADKQIEISLLLDPKVIEESVLCYSGMQKMECTSLFPIIQTQLQERKMKSIRLSYPRVSE